MWQVEVWGEFACESSYGERGVKVVCASVCVRESPSEGAELEEVEERANEIEILF